MLIVIVEHHVDMLGIILIGLVVAFLPLAYLAGADSRIDETARRRRYQG